MSVKIKKINKVTSFCGLSKISLNSDFKDYNVIFANNGAGKTSITRAFELLVDENYKHANQYQTIDSADVPEISFTLNNNSLITINNTNLEPKPSFKVEIYNSDFIIRNAPLGSEFTLKKLNDESIVFQDSNVGEETKKIQELNAEKEKVTKRQSDIKGELVKNDEKEKAIEEKIEVRRKNVTTKIMPISINEITINSALLNENNTFEFNENNLRKLETDFDELDTAMKSFENLSEINF